MWMTITFILCAVHFLAQRISGLNFIDLPIQNFASNVTIKNKQHNMKVLKSNQSENANYYKTQQHRFANYYANEESVNKQRNVNLSNYDSNELSIRRQNHPADVDPNAKYYKIQQQLFANYYSNAESDNRERNVSVSDYDSNAFSKQRQNIFPGDDSNAKLNRKERSKYSDYDFNAKVNEKERYAGPANYNSNVFSKQRQSTLAVVDSNAKFPRHIKNYQEKGSIELHKKEYEDYGMKDAQLNTRKPLKNNGEPKGLTNKKREFIAKQPSSDVENEELFSKKRGIHVKNKIRKQLTTLKKLPHKDYDDAEYRQLETKRIYPPVRERKSTPMSDPKHIRRYWLMSQADETTNSLTSLDTNDKDVSLKNKIGSLVEQTMHDTRSKIKQVQSYKESLKEVPAYKIGFILSLIKKTRNVINDFYNLAVKHRDEWKALQQLNIFELVVHTNVDTGHLVRQMVEVHLQSIATSTTKSTNDTTPTQEG